MNSNFRKLLESIKSFPFSAWIFTVLGVTLSVGTFLLVNFRHGLPHFFMIELGHKMTTVPSHDDYIYLLHFVVGGLLFSLGFSIHWYIYAGLSSYIKSNILSWIFGVIILVGDAYIRIRSVFFPKHSTDSIAVACIPIIIGGPALIAYALIGLKGTAARRKTLDNKNTDRVVEENDKIYCIHCGSEVRSNDNYCTKCGKHIGNFGDVVA